MHMSDLLSTSEKNNIGIENAKPEVGASGFASGPGMTDEVDVSIIPRPPNYHKRGLQMSVPELGFLKLKRSQELEDLLRHYPDAFLLLTLISVRAKRTSAISFTNLLSGRQKNGSKSPS